MGNITVLPAASAAAIFQAIYRIGAFQEAMAAQTPYSSRRTILYVPSSAAKDSPKILSAQSA
jgi:hypothetical protein